MQELWSDRLFNAVRRAEDKYVATDNTRWGEKVDHRRAVPPRASKAAKKGL